MRRAPGAWLAAAAAVVVGAAVVAGLVVVGGPGEARLERLDRERIEDLRAVSRAAVQAWERTGVLPPSLDQVGAARLAGDARADPATGEPYGYRVLADSTFEVCATFARAGGDAPDRRLGSDDLGLGAHGAGRHCFTVEVPAAP